MVPVGLFFCYEGGGSLCGVWGGGEAICSQKECNRTSNNAMHSGESKKRTAIILITKNNFAII